MKRLVVAAAVVFAVAALPGAAHAQTSTPPCEATVVDTTGKLADIAKVEEAAGQLRAAGAFVRVRVESNVGSDADSRMRDLQTSCPEWMSAGDRRADMIAVIVLVDTRQTGIYYGSQYTASLDGSWKNIQASSMNPRFKEGFFDVGIADGLDAVRGAVTGITPTPNYTSPPYSYPSYNSPSYSSPSSSDSGSSIAGIVVLIVLGIALIVGLNVIAANRTDTFGSGSFGSGSFGSGSFGSGSFGSGSFGSGTKRRATGWFGGTSGSSSHSSWSSSSSNDSSWSSGSSSSSSSSSDSGGSSDGGGSSSW
jgi:hypothetical protein